MLVHTVKFKDVEGADVERVLHFNLSKDEMTGLELEHHEDGGFIQWFANLYANKHMKQAYDELRSLIDMSFGERDPEDKTVFDKSDEVKARFKKNLARTAMMDALISDEVLFTTFIKTVFPIEMLNMKEVDLALAKAKEQAKADAAKALEESKGNSTATPS